jgi:hypothetical protein
MPRQTRDPQMIVPSPSDERNECDLEPFAVHVSTFRGSGISFFAAIAGAAAVAAALSTALWIIDMLGCRIGPPPLIPWPLVALLASSFTLGFGLLVLVLRQAFPKGTWLFDHSRVHYEALDGRTKELAWSEIRSVRRTRCGVLFLGQETMIVLPLVSLEPDVRSRVVAHVQRAMSQTASSFAMPGCAQLSTPKEIVRRKVIRVLFLQSVLLIGVIVASALAPIIGRGVAIAMVFFLVVLIWIWTKRA